MNARQAEMVAQRMRLPEQSVQPIVHVSVSISTYRSTGEGAVNTRGGVLRRRRLRSRCYVGNEGDKALSLHSSPFLLFFGPFLLVLSAFLFEQFSCLRATLDAKLPSNALIIAYIEVPSIVPCPHRRADAYLEFKHFLKLLEPFLELGSADGAHIRCT